MSGTAPGDTHHIHAGGKFLPFNTLSAPLTALFYYQKAEEFGNNRDKKSADRENGNSLRDFGFVSICRHWKLSSSQHL